MLLRFASISDIHFSSVLDNNAKIFYRKALQGLQKETNNSLDAVIITGDFSEGYQQDYDTLISLTKKYAFEDISLIASYGNHEGDMKHFQYEVAFGLPVDNVRTVRGFKFICVGAHAGDTYLESQASWLDNQLGKFTKEEPNKPVFILIHHPIFDTHTVNTGDKTLVSTLQKYRQSFVLTGHDHLLFSKNSFWKKEYISFRNSFLQNVEKGEFALISITEENRIIIDQFEVNLVDEGIKKINTIEIDYQEFLSK